MEGSPSGLWRTLGKRVKCKSFRGFESLSFRMIKENSKKIWKKYNGLIVFILFLIQILVLYKLIQAYVPDGVIFKTAWDDKIPFLSGFVIPYFLFFIVLFLPFILACKKKKIFLALSTSYFFVATVCSLVYVFFQTTINRPEIVSSTIFNKLILFIYSIDEPLNLFPSGHVTFSVLATLCLFKINKKIGYIVLPITVLIVLSTLFVKQHHIPDVLAGLVLAYVGYRFIFRKMIK